MGGETRVDISPRQRTPRFTFRGGSEHDTLGEFPKIPIMEDVAFADSLKGKIKPLDILAHTSAEKYHNNGWLRQSIINFFILTQYRLGKSPNQLFKSYYKN